MKDNQFGYAVFIITVVVAAIFIFSGCTSPPPDRSVCCPVCEGCIEGVEDPYLCSKYYADKERARAVGDY